MVKKILGLIPIRLNSKRLSQKALLYIDNYPMVVHVYKRAKLSKKLNEVIVCCESKKIYKILKHYGCKAIMTSTKHKNGTERIAEGYQKIKRNFDLVIDIQGDEPLIDPGHIDQIIDFHINNNDADIVLPSLKISKQENDNIIKIVKDVDNKVLYLSRSKVPYDFRIKKNYLYKHLSIISFKPKALIKFSKSKITHLEKIEGIELLRAIELGLTIKSPNLKGNSFAVEVKSDYNKAKIFIKRDRFYKFYK